MKILLTFIVFSVVFLFAQERKEATDQIYIKKIEQSLLNKIKTMQVKKIKSIDIASEVSEKLDELKIDFYLINEVNWKAYPYKPKVHFRIAHDDQNIYLNYQVSEKCVRARYISDNSSVWKDSCVEFFILPMNEKNYYNFEANCIGTVLLANGPNGQERTNASLEILKKIKRWSSLPNVGFEERITDVEWELSLIIPVTALFRDSITTLSGKTMYGNFYKCGDELSSPHFLSWNPIETMNPSFHQPDFFGKLIFED
jgi:hypothetical protein